MILQNPSEYYDGASNATGKYNTLNEEVIQVRYLTAIGLLAGAYFAAGSLGQILAIPPGNVSVVWPSSGIALAAVLLGGNRLWPGIWLGALLVNVRTLFDPTLAPSFTASLAVGAAIATGSTAQALAGGRLVARLTGGRRSLERARGVFLFASGAALMCLIASAVGATSLALGGFIPRQAYGFTWWTWWLGDATGVIVVAPLLLTWSQPPRAAAATGSRVETAVFLILLLAAGQLIFGNWPLSGRSGAPTVYLAFPLLMWAAFRFGQRGATTAVLIMTAMAILGTARGAGPFQDVAVPESLWLLQAYGGVLAISTLTLAAVVTERHKMEEVLNECNRSLEQRVAERSAVAEQRAEQLARSEEACRNQACILQSILDNLLEGIVVADPRGKFVLWNPAAERHLGVKIQDIAQEQWPSYYGCFLQDQVTHYPAGRLPLARALRGETVEAEDMFLCNPSRPDGVWLRMSAVPLRDGAAELVGGMVVFRDISESKHAELRLRSVIESALTGFVMVDEAGEIALVNRQAEVIFGYTREELYGQPIEVLVPEHLRQAHRRHIEGYLRDPQRRPMAASQDIRGLRKDGRTVDLLVALDPIRQDGRLSILASVLDITEQRRAAEALRESENRLRLAMTAARLGTWDYDTVSGQLTWSDRCKAIHGLPPGAAVDLVTFLDRLHPEDRERVDQLVQGTLESTGGGVHDIEAEYRVLWPDNTMRWVVVMGQVLFDVGEGNGHAVRLIGTVQDITEHRQAEAQRAELLRRLVSAQEDERRRIARELHDQMGQYLAALGLATKAIQDSLPDEAPGHTHLQQIQEMTSETGQLVHRLAWELRPSALDDLGLVTAVSYYAAEWAERNEVTLHFHTDGLMPACLPPELETTIYRIVQEALTNIARHARAGHVGLILEQREDALLVIIEDDGQGFNVEEQMGPALTGGRLGLLGMRERAALVAGTLTVESAPGEGTTVFLCIPVSRGRKEDADA